MNGRLATLLGLDLPLLQAGMGGVAGVGLAAAVSAVGAGGVLGLYRSDPDHIRRVVTATAAATDRPFGVNVIPEVVGPVTVRSQVTAALERLPGHGFVTFFGLPDTATAAAVSDTGRPVVVQVGTVADADTAVGLGADVIVLQGTEAGGHLLGTTPAAPLLAAVRLRHPQAALVVAGGIATGADLARVLAAGADGAMAGTLFVPTDESDAHPVFKRRVLAATARDTVTTSLFEIGWPGRPHRVLRNVVTESPERLPALFVASTVVNGRTLPIPRYSTATPSVRTRGAVADMAMYCGRSCDRIITSGTVACVLDRFGRELDTAMATPVSTPVSTTAEAL